MFFFEINLFIRKNIKKYYFIKKFIRFSMGSVKSSHKGPMQKKIFYNCFLVLVSCAKVEQIQRFHSDSEKSCY